MQFMPDRVFFEPASLDYPLGQQLYNLFQEKGVETVKTSLRNVSRSIPGETESHKYAASKRSLVVAVSREKELDVCRPSADFEFSLVSGCPGHCEYCYLQTSQAYRPYQKIFVNVEDILETLRQHIAQNEGRITTFEAASLGDPLALEHLTGSLARTIEFFGMQENGRLRLVTKFAHVDPMLTLRHNGHTRFRFSINSRYVIHNFEHNTASFDERIEAASKIASASYPIGFIVAPIMLYDGWKEEYGELFHRLRQNIDAGSSGEPVTFELIQHRFTAIAKEKILKRFPDTRLDLNEENRALKWGKYGRFKYVYPKETAEEMKTFISSQIRESFPEGIIEYFT